MQLELSRAKAMESSKPVCSLPICIYPDSFHMVPRELDQGWNNRDVQGDAFLTHKLFIFYVKTKEWEMWELEIHREDRQFDFKFRTLASTEPHFVWQ